MRYELTMPVIPVAHTCLRRRRLRDQVASFIPRIAPLSVTRHCQANRLMVRVVLGTYDTPVRQRLHKQIAVRIVPPGDSAPGGIGLCVRAPLRIVPVTRHRPQRIDSRHRQAALVRLQDRHVP
ncbi:hypothetical protein X941_4291 [Burkholderia pseudomallei MSHR5569]|nr:hypothetical protein X941_4291 [Burkholderia pseudomallei MSHR5569]